MEQKFRTLQEAEEYTEEEQVNPEMQEPENPEETDVPTDEIPEDEIQQEYDPQEQDVDQEDLYDPHQIEQSQEEPQLITNEYKKIKLLDLSLALVQYMKVFKNTFRNIEYDRVTDQQLKILNNLYDDLDKTVDGLNFYISNVYEFDEYNKNLYTYLLYNKKLSEILQRFRRTLSLDKVNDGTNNKKE